MGPKARRPKYLVVNADEMEPGTFKDRILLEGNPHLLIEGVILAAYAIEAEIAYIFLRNEYHVAARRLEHALSEAREAGLLKSLAIHLHRSGGRYICGEETALLNALEGKRAIPRSKPPYPATSGLFGKPTVVNNVETICCVPGLITHGVDWFKNLSFSDEGGSKLYGISGRVRRPGVWELPLGTTIREILEEHAGGMREGFYLKGIIPGGASTDFVGPDQLDVRMDFASMMKAGSRLGTGTMIILDDRTCPIGMLYNLERFFAQESCGWCTPCRDGLPWVAKTLKAIEEGKGQQADLEILDEHCRDLGLGHTFCALAPGAMEPLQSALRLFRDDFERHIKDQRCPYRNGMVSGDH